MKLFLSVLSPFYIGSTPGRAAVISFSGVIWYVRPSQAAACDTNIKTWFSIYILSPFETSTETSYPTRNTIQFGFTFWSLIFS